MSSNHQADVKSNKATPLAPDIELAILPTGTQQSLPSDPPSKFSNLFFVTLTNSDPTNPKDWFNRLKWAVTDVLSATGFNGIMVSTIMASALSTIAIELHMSEVFGIQEILHAGNVWFLTKEVLISARFLAGFGASNIYALAGGVLEDAWRPEQKGRSLGVYLLIPLLGAAVGPIIGGFMAGRTTWRWMFCSTSIFQAVMIAVSFTAFKETYAPRLSADKSIFSILSNALTRPLRLLLFHPIIIIASVNLTFDYGILYIALTSFAELWTNYYQLAGALPGAPTIDRYHRWKKAQHLDGDLAPEYRLPVIFYSALLAPVGLFIYGWTAEHRVHWVAVEIRVFIAMFGFQMSGMAWQAYIMDTCLTAFLFSLFVPKMYRAMRYGWCNTAMAFASLILAVPGLISL
ncbi:MFS general substrate transporter [Macroventuria anomochaeta]|uniref:MFS general substrate transporter n=1 Tax=Macroventuria anomochaeta TaxID=301207 RepID=A0ACB6SHS5_9PLEO|nr:MFS general substrate transporter [Macroventuria anomochaeta]KAF2633042.1 MFS general substrate transporter [Macroventuria anomochaeta]